MHVCVQKERRKCPCAWIDVWSILCQEVVPQILTLIVCRGSFPGGCDQAFLQCPPCLSYAAE
eukprot:m.49053 g.49053  ORF g.49053 m.49053 type:complete len:62 (+) comp17867_c0_seq2:498-683(+)